MLNITFSGIQWFLNQTGPCTTTHIESGGFTRSRPGVTHPDIMFHFFPSQLVDHGRTTPSLEAFQIHAGPMRQASRGWIKLKSKNPKEHPLIQPNYLSEGKNTYLVQISHLVVQYVNTGCGVFKSGKQNGKGNC